MIIAINKPKGITSHDVVDVVRKKYNITKVGHAGTLDPLAEGILIVLTEKDTKSQSEFMGLEKEYIAEIAFGIRTDTYDIEGTVLENDKLRLAGKVLEKGEIEKVLNKFVGNIIQEVPAFSAVKIRGKPLYKYAREGKMEGIKLPKRKVFIKELELLETGTTFVSLSRQRYNFPAKKYPYIKIRLVCSKGTYVRSLANDIGNKLGGGGTLISLVRTRIGNYTLENSLSLERFLM